MGVGEMAVVENGDLTNLVQMTVPIDSCLSGIPTILKPTALLGGPHDKAEPPKGLFFGLCLAALNQRSELVEFNHMTVAKCAIANSLLNEAGRDIRIRFPAAVNLLATNNISSALIGGDSWQNPKVRHDAIYLLNNPEAAAKFYNNWQSQMVKEVLDVFQELKAAERLTYGVDLFFLWKENNPGAKTPLNELDPSPVWSGEAYTRYCK